jgi:HD-GYP domain-containing protein (c-di-GMP phosphodiesterase class II)
MERVTRWAFLAQGFPWAARLVAIVDVYDTLTHPRSYGPVFTHAEALDELARSAGSQLDPALVPLAALFLED